MVLPLLERLDTGGCTNPLAPQWPANRVLLQRRLLESGLSDCVSGNVMRAIADEVRKELR
jgi:hypothetical protein